MSQATPPPAANHSLDQLLKVGVDAARSGNRQAARSLFLALAREHPDDVRVWLGLAGVAASRNEQREALERIVALDPANQRARTALSQLDTAAPGAAEAPTQAPAAPAAGVATAPRGEQAAAAPPRPDAPAEDEQPRQTPFPLLNAIALGLILLLLAALGVILGRALLGSSGGTGTPAATATPALVVVVPGGQPPAAATGGPELTAAPGGQPDAAPTSPPALTVAPAATEPLSGGDAATPASSPPTTAPATADAFPGQGTPAPAPNPGQPATLPMGVPIEHDGWTTVLVSPDYALPLDGAIGDLQPGGRFVLTVVAVSNNSPSPRVLPPDMFLLVDGAGRAYAPVPGASTAYLALYERAQRGDLALEDTFDPVVGLRSVPVIFDVPLDATGLRLTVNGAGPAGWPVGENLPPSSPSGP